MVRLVALLLVALTAQAAERWVEFRSGPFEVSSNAGERAGRQRLNELEQLRYGLEQVLGRTEIRPVWPIRILVFDQAAEAAPTFGWSRDAYYGAIPAQGAPPRSFLRACALRLIESGQGRLPDPMEQALADLFSTLEVKGSEVLLGAPLPQPQRTRAWAEMHLLAVKEPYYGKLRTLLYNLERGVEPDPAYRNALGKSPAEIDKEAEAYWRAGNFAATPLKRKPINPERDFEPKPIEAARGALLRADLLLADPSRAAEADAAYQAILKSTPATPEALEGRALAALKGQRQQEARGLLVQAIEASTTNAGAYVEYARLEPDRDKAVAALEKAAKLNPAWAEPQFEMAQREPDAALRIQLLAAAARKEPRNVEYWRALAQAQDNASLFSDAAKSWASAELAVGSPEERQRIRDVRAHAEERRREQAEQERQRKAREAKQAIVDLREKSMASIQEAIDKANRERPPEAPSSGKVEPWWDGARADGKVQGVLRQVDCLGKQARLVIEGDDRKTTRLLVRDPAQIAFAGGGEKTLTCGPQKPARRVVVEYYINPDAKLGTAGDVAVIGSP
jgi:hypothetical protein